MIRVVSTNMYMKVSANVLDYSYSNFKVFTKAVNICLYLNWTGKKKLYFYQYCLPYYCDHGEIKYNAVALTCHECNS